MTVQNDPVQIDHFNRFSALATIGTCAELAYSAYHRIQASFPNYSAFVAVGTEPTYFANKDDAHVFLLASPISVSNPEQLADLPMNEVYVVDPSFQAVLPISSSRYGLQYFYPAEDFTQNHQEFPENGNVVLGIDSQDRIFGLRGCSQNSVVPIQLGISQIRESFSFFDNTIENEFGEDEKIMPYVIFFRELLFNRLR